MSTRCSKPPRTHKRAVVIGGGLLGLEAAWGLKQRGMSVALVHLMPTLMERQLDAAAGQLLQRDLDRRGIAFFTNGQTEEITGTERAEGVQLADGRFIPADLVVLAIGIRPNIDLARAAGLEVNRGIVVFDDMRTSDPDIFAVGECVEHRGQVFGLVAPIWDQAKVCAARLAGDETARVRLRRALDQPEDHRRRRVLRRRADGGRRRATTRSRCATIPRGIYKKIVLRDGQARRRGALWRCRRRSLVPAADARQGRRQRLARTACLRPRLRRSRQAGRPPAAGCRRDARRRRRSAAATACRKGAIVAAIRDKKLVIACAGARPHQGVGLVRPVHLRRSKPCSPSRPASRPSPPRRPLCECTDAGHDEVRQRDRSRRSSRPWMRCAVPSAGRSRTAATNAARR